MTLNLARLIIAGLPVTTRDGRHVVKLRVNGGLILGGVNGRYHSWHSDGRTSPNLTLPTDLCLSINGKGK